MSALTILNHFEFPEEFHLNKDFTLKNGEWNWRLLVTRDGELRERFGDLRYNVFAQKPYLNGKPLTDDDEVAMAMYIAEKYRIYPTTSNSRFGAVLRYISLQDAHDPLLDYVNGLDVWDKTPRLDTLLHEQFNAALVDKDEEKELEAQPLELRKLKEKRGNLLAKVSRCFFISAIARALDPGVKADCCMILSGPQGAGKSQACAALVPEREWFTSSPIDLKTKDGRLLLQGRWIIEIKELDSFRGARQTAIKAFMDEQFDAVRPLYARNFVDLPRRCVFLGTTNEDRPLRDTTGNRRYFVVRVGDNIGLTYLRNNRDQIWAEAKWRYLNKEQWWLDKDDTDDLNESNLRFMGEDPWQEAIHEWVLGRKPSSTGEILMGALNMDKSQMERRHEVRVSGVMKVLNYKSKQRSVGGIRKSVWQSQDQKRTK